MIIPLQYHCKACNATEWVKIDQEAHYFRYTCDCGHEGHVFLSADYNIETKILYKSQYELKENEDYPLSIVLSATAFECALSRLYFKWTDIDMLKQAEEISNPEIEQMLRRFRTVDSKIENVAKLMNPEGLADFIETKSDFAEIINTGFPSLDIDTLSRSFQEKLFWPRNRILHLGDSNYNELDAIRCLNISSLGMTLFKEMDTFRSRS